MAKKAPSVKKVHVQTEGKGGRRLCAACTLKKEKCPAKEGTKKKGTKKGKKRGPKKGSKRTKKATKKASK